MIQRGNTSCLFWKALGKLSVNIVRSLMQITFKVFPLFRQTDGLHDGTQLGRSFQLQNESEMHFFKTEHENSEFWRINLSMRQMDFIASILVDKPSHCILLNKPASGRRCA